jgi:phage gp16-like protein
MINGKQIKIIHTLKGALSMDEDSYRSMLASFGVESSKELTPEKAERLITELQRSAESAGVWKARRQARRYTSGKKRFEHLGNRRGYASPAQLRMLESMWVEVSRADTLAEKQDAINRFLEHRFGVANLAWLPSDMVGKVVKAIQAMKEAKSVDSK